MTRALAFTGLVLAGGTSSRMGCDKASLTYKGKRWLEHTADLLSQAGASDILVNAHIPHGFKTLSEPYPNKGPLSGIYAALLSTSKPLLVMPVDMPNLSIDLLKKLVNEGANNQCVYYETSPLPCFLHNTQAQRDCIKHRLTRPNSPLSLYSTWRELKAKVIATHMQLNSYNCPEDMD